MRLPAGLDFPTFADTLLWIRDEMGNIIPYVRNPIQKRIYEIIQKERARGNRYFIILKYRRGGITTDQQAINFYESLKRGRSVVTLAHEANDTEKIFNIAKLFYSQLWPAYQPKRSRKVKRELEYPDLNSEYYIGTAGGKAFARGSTLQRFHASEVAFWPGQDHEIDNLMASLCEAARAGEGVLESTANGVSNWFHTRWKEVEAGRALWVPIFLAWHEDYRNQIPVVSEDERQAILSNLLDAEAELVEKHNLTAEQIKWRRIKKDALRKLFAQEYPESADEAFLNSGISYFDSAALQRIQERGKDPVSTSLGGMVKIWKLPEGGKEYVAGSDVASGADPNSDKLDYSVTHILDRVTGEHVATLKGKIKPHEFAKQSARLCERYNNAFWGVERNEYGHAVLNSALNVLRYKNLYKHQKYDKASKQKISQHGWPTNKETRPIMIDDLAKALEKDELLTKSISFVNECKSFVLKKGRMEAESGAHDDEVFAMAIAWQMRKARRKVPGIII